MKLFASLVLLTFTTIATLTFAQDTSQTGQSDTAAAPPQNANSIRVSMRDGIELALEIFHPARSGQFPTLLAAGPYPYPGTPGSGELTGPIAELVSQGYNYVLASVRGTGTSGGSYEFMGREEQQDLYEIVEWIAGQSWSDGQIAGVGAGYYGTMQWLMAIQNPPHLSCIAPVDAVLDLYRDWAWHGGVASSDFRRWYEQDIREAHAYPNQGQPRYIDFDLQLQQLQHKLPDSWWSLRSPATNLDQVKVPVLQLGSFYGSLTPWLGALPLLNTTPAGTHTYISNKAHLLQDQQFLREELLPYYQWCFGGQPNTGPALQPKLRYQQANTGQMRASTTWPPANIKFTPLFLQATNDSTQGSGKLLPDQNSPGRNRTELGADAGQDSIDFRTAPVLQDMDIAGPMLLELQISSTGTDTAFAAELYEETVQTRFGDTTPVIPTFLEPELKPQQELLTANKQTLITSGVLKASRRALLAEADSNKQVTYTYGDPEPLYPGRVYRIDLALDPTAWRIKAGSRLVLKIRQLSDASLRKLQRTDTLYHTAQYPTRLWLPLAADATPGFAAEVLPAQNSQTDANQSNSIFILDSFLPAATATGTSAANGAENTGLKTPEEQLADELFNSDDPVILLPQ